MNMPNRFDQGARMVWAILRLACKKFLRIDGTAWADAILLGMAEKEKLFTGWTDVDLSPDKANVWAVGERVDARPADAGLPLLGLFTVPNSVKAITPLVGQMLVESEARRTRGEVTFFNILIKDYP